MLWRLSNRAPRSGRVSAVRVRSTWRFSGGSRSPDASWPTSSISTLRGLSSRAANTPAGPEPTTMTSNNPVPPEGDGSLQVLERRARHGAAENEPGTHRPVGLVHEAPVIGGPDLGEVDQQPELAGQRRPLSPEDQLDRLDIEFPGDDRPDGCVIRPLAAVMAVSAHIPLFELRRDGLPEQRGVEVASLRPQLAIALVLGLGLGLGRPKVRHGRCASDGPG